MASRTSHAHTIRSVRPRHRGALAAAEPGFSSRPCCRSVSRSARASPGSACSTPFDSARCRFPNADRLVLISEVPDDRMPERVRRELQDVRASPRTCFHIDRRARWLHWRTEGARHRHRPARCHCRHRFGHRRSTCSALAGARPHVHRRRRQARRPGDDAHQPRPLGDVLQQRSVGARQDFTLSDEPFTVIGVMPPGFAFESRSQVWLAASRYLDPRTGTSLRSIERARAARARRDTRAARGRAAHARGRGKRRTSGEESHDLRGLAAARSVRERDAWHDVIFAAIVAAILAIGCANVASLVLVRAMRHRASSRFAARSARVDGVLTRYLFVENAVLCVAGLMVGSRARGCFAQGCSPWHRCRRATRVAGMDYRLDVRAFGFAVVLTARHGDVVLSLAPVRLFFGPTSRRRFARDRAPRRSRAADIACNRASSSCRPRAPSRCSSRRDSW